MSTTITTIAIGKWNDRANLDYKPVNSILENGKRYDARGKEISDYPRNTVDRRPYKFEETDTTAYVMYDDDAEKEVPIYRIVQEG